MLAYPEFQTLIIQIEVLPLCPISSDPTNVIAVTPGHFLVGTFLTDILGKDQTQSTHYLNSIPERTVKEIRYVWKNERCWNSGLRCYCTIKTAFL